MVRIPMSVDRDQVRCDTARWQDVPPQRLAAYCDELLAEVDQLSEALEQIAHPNWRVNPTGADARDMAAYANGVLDKLYGSGSECDHCGLTTHETFEHSDGMAPR